MLEFQEYLKCIQHKADFTNTDDEIDNNDSKDESDDYNEVKHVDINKFFEDSLKLATHSKHAPGTPIVYSSKQIYSLDSRNIIMYILILFYTENGGLKIGQSRLFFDSLSIYENKYYCIKAIANKYYLKKIRDRNLFNCSKMFYCKVLTISVA